MEFIKENGSFNVPNHLRSRSLFRFGKNWELGGYLYPRLWNGYVKQNYLPDDIKNLKFYEPKEIGNENRYWISKKLKDEWKNFRKEKVCIYHLKFI